MPWILIAVTLVSLLGALLEGDTIFWVLSGGQIGSFALAGAGVISTKLRTYRPVRLVTYFMAMNAALALGLIKYVRGPSLDIWSNVR